MRTTFMAALAASIFLGGGFAHAKGPQKEDQREERRDDDRAERQKSAAGVERRQSDDTRQLIEELKDLQKRLAKIEARLNEMERPDGKRPEPRKDEPQREDAKRPPAGKPQPEAKKPPMPDRHDAEARKPGPPSGLGRGGPERGPMAGRGGPMVPAWRLPPGIRKRFEQDQGGSQREDTAKMDSGRCPCCEMMRGRKHDD